MTASSSSSSDTADSMSTAEPTKHAGPQCTHAYDREGPLISGPTVIGTRGQRNGGVEARGGHFLASSPSNSLAVRCRRPPTVELFHAGLPGLFNQRNFGRWRHLCIPSRSGTIISRFVFPCFSYRFGWTISVSSQSRKESCVETASFFDWISVEEQRRKKGKMEGRMGEKAQMEQHSSAAAFVEGGVQDGCDDACSICLEAFSDSDPSAVTNCKHEFHLQCILECLLDPLRCQRSSQCPMCWQAIGMKDPMSQELLEAVEHERNVQGNRVRTTAVYRHPLLGDFEVPVGADDAEIEERIMQHLAAAAAVRRSHRRLRREGRRGRSAAHDHPQMLVFSATEATSGDSISLNPREEGNNEHIISALPITPVAATEVTTANTSVHDATAANCPVGSNNSQDEAGPSDLQSFSDTLKSHLQSVSTRYKDSITKNTRGWKERWFTNNNISNIGSEVKREVSAGIAAVSRMMERLDARASTGLSSTPSDNIQSASDTNNQRDVPQESATDVNGALPSATCMS
ncbi:hypothetical protein EJB05_14999, partial [Eragrostis curvula]